MLVKNCFPQNGMARFATARLNYHTVSYWWHTRVHVAMVSIPILIVTHRKSTMLLKELAGWGFVYAVLWVFPAICWLTLQYWVQGFSLQYHKSSLTGRCCCTMTQMKVILKLGVHTSCNSPIFVATIQMKTSLKIITAEWINFWNYGSARQSLFQHNYKYDDTEWTRKPQPCCYCFLLLQLLQPCCSPAQKWNWVLLVLQDGDQNSHMFRSTKRYKTADFLVKTNHPQNTLRARPVRKARRNWRSLFVVCHPSILGWGVWDTVAPSQGGRHREWFPMFLTQLLHQGRAVEGQTLV